jgi:hypothetical protein
MSRNEYNSLPALPTQTPYTLREVPKCPNA